MTYSIEIVYDKGVYILRNYTKGIAKYLIDDTNKNLIDSEHTLDRDELQYVADHWEPLPPYRRTIYKLLAARMSPQEEVHITVASTFTSGRLDRASRYLLYLEQLADTYRYKEYHDAEAYIRLVEYFNEYCLDEAGELKALPVVVNDIEESNRGNLSSVRLLSIEGYLTGKKVKGDVLVGTRSIFPPADIDLATRRNYLGPVNFQELLTTPEAVEDYVYPKLNPGYVKELLAGNIVVGKYDWYTYPVKLIFRKNRDRLGIADILPHSELLTSSLTKDAVPIYDYSKLNINERTAIGCCEGRLDLFLSSEEILAKAEEILVGEAFRSILDSDSKAAKLLLDYDEGLCKTPHQDLDRSPLQHLKLQPFYFEIKGKDYLQLNWTTHTGIITHTFMIPPYGLRLISTDGGDFRSKAFQNSVMYSKLKMEDLNKIIEVLPNIPLRTVLTVTVKHMKSNSKFYTLDLLERVSRSNRTCYKISKINTYFNHYRNLAEMLIFKEDYTLSLFNELVTKYEKTYKALLNVSGNMKYFPYFGVYKQGKLIMAETSLISLKHIWDDEDVTYSYEIDTGEQESKIEKDIRALRAVHKLRKDHRVLIPDLTAIKLVDLVPNDFQI